MTAECRGPARAAIVGLALGLALAGCAQESRSLYSARDVGIMIETTEATVIASRTVDIEGKPGPAGPVAGAVSAATLVAALAGGGALASLATVVGGLLGAGVGYAAEKEISSGQGIEYVLETFDGRTMTIVQREDDEPRIANGTPVLLQMSGGYSRIIEHPQMDADAPQVDWRNPDEPDLSPSLPEGDDALLAPLLDERPRAQDP